MNDGSLGTHVPLSSRTTGVRACAQWYARRISSRYCAASSQNLRRGRIANIGKAVGRMPSSPHSTGRR